MLRVYCLHEGSFECSVSHTVLVEYDHGNNGINNNLIHVLFLALLHPYAAFRTSSGAKY